LPFPQFGTQTVKICGQKGDESGSELIFHGLGVCFYIFLFAAKTQAIQSSQGFSSIRYHNSAWRVVYHL